MPPFNDSLDSSAETPVIGSSNVDDSSQSYGGSLDGAIKAEPLIDEPKFLLRFNRLALTLSVVVMIVLIVIGVAALLLGTRSNGGNGKSLASQSGNYAVGSIQTKNIPTGDQALQLGSVNTLQINGQLQASQGIVLSPTAKPSNAVSGQIYYDKTTNQPYYYNGTSFVSLASGSEGVTSLGGITGVIALGTGLSVTGNQLSISGNILQTIGGNTQTTQVSSVQGEVGNIAFSSGTGISINGTTISSTGIQSLQAGNGIAVSGNQISNNGVIDLTSSGNSIRVTPEGNGVFDLEDSNGGSGGVTSLSSMNGSITVSNGGSGNYDVQIAPSGVSAGSYGTSSTAGVFTVNAAGQLTNVSTVPIAISGSQITSGTLGDAYLSSNAALYNRATSNFTGALQDDGYSVCTINGNCVGVPGGGIGGSGTAGDISMFTGIGYTVGNSSLSQTSGNVVDSGNLAIQGTGGLTLGNGSDTATIKSSSTGTPTFTLPSSTGSSGQCLETDGTGVLSFANCLSGSSGGSGGVTSLNGLSGSLTLVQGSSLSITTGASSVTLGLTATGVTAGTYGSASTAGIFTVNAEGQLTSANSASIAINGNQITSGTVNNSYLNSDVALYDKSTSNFTGTLEASGNTVCTTVGNCTGMAGGSLGGSGTTGVLPVFTGSGYTLGNSVLSQSDGDLTDTGYLAVQGAGGLVLGSGSATTTIESGSTSAITFTLPNSVGTSGECLTTDGTGVLSFETCLSGSGSGGGVSSLNSISGALLITQGSGISITTGSSSISVGLAASGVTTNSYGSASSVATFTVNSQGELTAANSTPISINGNQITTGTVGNSYLSADVGLYDNATSNFTGNLEQGGNSVCTTVGNCTGVSGGSIGGSGAAGDLAVFTGSGYTVGNSSLTQNSGNLTASGNLTVQGSGGIILGTGSATTTIKGSSSSAISFTLPAGTGASGQCLVTNGSGVLSFSGCLSGSSGGTGGVTSLDSLSGAVTLQDGSGELTFTNTGQAINIALPQNLTTASSPTFAGLTLTNPLTIANGGTGQNTAPSSGKLLIGNSGGTYSLANLTQGTGLTVTNGSGSITLGISNTTVSANSYGSASSVGTFTVNAEGQLTAAATTPIAINGNQITSGTVGDGYLNSDVALYDNLTSNFTGALQQGGNTVCTVAGNCTGVSGGSIGGSGSLGSLAMFTGSGYTIGSSALSQTSGNLSDSGNLAIQGTGGVTLGSGSATTTILSGSSGAISFTLPSTVGTSGQCLTTGGTGGALSFTNCLTGSSGGSGGVSSINGFSGSVTAAQGTGLTVSNSSNTITLGISNTTVSANSYGSASSVGTFTVNAEGQLTAAATTPIAINGNQITSGTVGDGYLNSDVALYDNLTSNFTGALQQGGNTVCTVAGNCNGVAGGAISGSGTAGTVALYTGSGYTIGNSVLTQSSSNLIDSGNLTIQGTGGVVIGSGSDTTALISGSSSAISFTLPSTVGTSGQCLTTGGTGGVLTFANCLTGSSGGSGGVSSLNTLSGAVVLQDTSNLLTFTNSGQDIGITLATTGVGASSYGSATNVATFTVNAEGQLTVAGSTPISINGNQITTGSVAAAQGGTGITSYTVGSLLYASSSSALGQLTDVATGQCLVSAGVGAVPTWSSCSGGAITGSGTSGQVALFNGTGTITGSVLTQTSGNLSSTGSLQVETSSNSTTAFIVQNATNASALDADTSNISVGIAGASTSAGYALNVTGTGNFSTNLYVNGSAVCTVTSGCGGSGSGFYINNSTSSQTGNFNIQSAAAGSVGAVVEGASGQTADLLDLKNSSLTVLSEFTDSGALQGGNGSGLNDAAAPQNLYLDGGQGTGTGTGGSIDLQISAASVTSGSSLNSEATVLSLSGVNGSATFKNTANSTTAFQVQNTSSSAILSVDTTNAGSISLIGSNSGETEAWQTNSNSLPTNSGYDPSSSVTYNGYVYYMTYNALYYAKLNANGSTGSWTTASSWTDAGGYNAKSGMQLLVANGYLYSVGGVDSNNSVVSYVFYTKINANGSIGSWQTNTSNMPAGREDGSVVYGSNGYIYYVGGDLSAGTPLSTVYYAQLNANGSTGSWTSTSLPYTLEYTSASVSNGYVYLFGGYDGTDNNAIQYAQLNSNGSLGSWSCQGTSAYSSCYTGSTIVNSNSLPANLSQSAATISNGYAYVIGGSTGSATSTVYYAQLNANGSTGSWSTSVNTLPAARMEGAATLSNDYIYYLGGTPDGNTYTTNVYYASLARVSSDASIDLVGGTNGSGGSITAGNGTFDGNLTTLGSASFDNGISVNGDSTFGQSLFQNSSNSTSALQIQNSSGASLLTADTSNMRLGVDVTYSAMSIPSGLSVGTATSGGNLTASTTYYYKVTALDSAGGETVASTQASGATNSSNLTLPVTWTAVSGATAYRVYRSTTSGSEVYLTTVYNNSFTDSGAVYQASTDTPPSSGNAYVATNNSTNNLQLSIGGNGSANSQLYVSGGDVNFLGTMPGGYETAYGEGNVAISGHYAYFTNNGYGFGVADISNPSDVTLVGYDSTGIGGSQSIAVSGQYAFVIGAWSGGAMQVYNISNPAVPGNPSPVASVTTGMDGPEYIVIQGDYAYVSNGGSNTIDVFNISNPLSPVLVSQITSGTYLYDINEMAVQQGYLYAYTSNGLAIYSISNPNSPTYTGFASGAANGCSTGIAVSGSYAYTVGGCSSESIDVINVSNPASPSVISSNSYACALNSAGIGVSGQDLYVASSGTNRLCAFNVANPSNPVYLGDNSDSNINTPSNNPIAISGNIAYIISDNGLSAYNLGGTYTQSLQTGTADVGSLQVDTNETVAGDENIQGGLSVGQSLSTGGNLSALGGGTIAGTLILSGGNNQLSVPGAPTITHSGTAGTTTYSYEVTAINAYGGETIPSASGSTTTGNATLSSTNYTTATWSSVSGATGYKIYRVVGGSTQGLIGETTSTSFNDIGLTASGSVPVANTTGQLSVQGSASFQNATNSTSALLIQNSSASSLLTADTTNMRLGVDVTYTAIGTPASVTATISSGGTLTASTTYYYKITAIDGAGGETTTSTEVSCKTGTTTSCSTGSLASNKTINLSWTADTGAVGYKIYRSTTSGSEVYLATTPKNSFSDNGSYAVGTATAPGSSNAYYASSNNSSSQLQLSVGGIGTASGQVYVSGTAPQYVTAAKGSISGNTSVTTSGNYEYVASGSTIYVIDISNKTDPIQVGSDTNTAGTIQSLVAKGQYLYVLSNNATLAVYSIANPAMPSNVAPVGSTTGGISDGQALTVQGNYAYITSFGNNSISIYDITNPTKPTLLSEIDNPNQVDLPYLQYSLAVQGNYAYVANYSSPGGVSVINISNPLDPTYVTNVGAGGCSQDVYVSGRYMYAWGSCSVSPYNIDVYDISNPASPVLTSTIGNATYTANVAQMVVEGQYFYFSNPTSNKVYMYNIANPSNPTFVTSNSDSNLSSPGAFTINGNYMYVESTNGLAEYSLGGTYTQSLQTGSAEVTNLQVDNGANIDGDVNAEGSVNSTNLQASGNLQVEGSTELQGSALLDGGVNTLATPSAPTITVEGTPGSTSYSYTVTATNAYGGETVASPAGSTTTGNATLTATNYNQITWSAVSGATGYKVYRTAAGGNSTGFIGSTPAGTTTLNDQGFTASGSNSPTINTTAQLTVEGSANFQNTTNSTTAFQVQDASGVNLLDADTTDHSLIVTGASNPSSITQVGSNVSTGSLPDGVAISGNYAYVVNYSSNTLQVFNVSNPSSVSQVGSNVTTGNEPYDIAVSGNYAYVVNYNSNTMQIFNISNPSSITQVGGNVSTGNSPDSIAISGNYAYVTNLNSNTIQAFNISNPNSVTSAGSASTGNQPRNIAISGNYAYIVEENGSNDMQIFNISNPSSITQVGSNVSTGSLPDGVAISGNYAYVVNYSSNTLQVFNVSNPSSVSQVGSNVTTGNEPYDIAVSGNYAYVVNYNSNTMQIFNISNPSSITQVGGNVSTGNSPDSIAISGNYAYVVNYSSNTLQVFNVNPTPTLQIKNASGTNVLSVDATDSGNLLTVNNGNSTTPANVLTLNDNGAAAFENSVNSTSAFQIQNSQGQALFNTDTLDSKIALNASTTIQASVPTVPIVIGATSGGNGSGTSEPITTSASTQTGDLVIITAYMEPANEGTGSATFGTITTPGGVTLLPGFPIETDASGLTTGDDHRMYAWYYYATANGSQTLTLTDTANVYWGLVSTTIRGGPSSGNPLSQTASTATTSRSASGITTTPAVSLNLSGPNSLVLWMTGEWDGYNSSRPSGYTDLDSDSGSQPDVSSNFYVNSGSTGSITAWSPGAADGLTAALLAIRGSNTNILSVDNYNGSNVASISAGNGAALFQNAVNSTNAFQIQNANDTNTILDADSTNGFIGIGTNAPAAELNVVGTNLTPALVYGGNGTNSSNVLTIQGATGGSTNDGGTVSGGSGAGISMVTGTGGNLGSSTTGTGGSGGSYTISLGTGGNVTTTSGASTGGSGGSYTLQAGNGGTDSSTTGRQGAGGSITIQAGTAAALTSTGQTLGTAGTITIEGGNGSNGTGTSADGNGGNLLLQGGAAGTGGSGTAGTSGTVTVKSNGTNSTTAFEIQNSIGTSLLTADTTNGAIDLGQDATHLGLTTVGLNNQYNASNIIESSEITPSTTGALSSISVFFGSGSGSLGNYQVAIYTNSSGAPGTLIASSGSNAVSGNEWNTTSLSASLTAGTSYWLAVNLSSNVPATYYSSSGGSYATKTSATYGTWPGTFGTPSYTSSSQLSMYANETPTSASYALTTNNNGQVSLGGSAVGDYQLNINGAGDGIFSDGAVLINTTSPDAFSVYGNGNVSLSVNTINNSVTLGATQLYSAYITNGLSVQNVSGDVADFKDSAGNLAVSVGNNDHVCLNDGTGTSGTCTGSETLGVVGAGVASGGFSTGTPDMAEYIDTSPEVGVGDLVIADPNNSEAVTTSTTPYDSAEVGVIANGTSGFQMLNAHYGQAFNAVTDSTDPNAKPMTVAGRVPVNVTGEGGSIKPGDYITTSSTAGYGMKATHAGQAIGIALGYFNGTSSSNQGTVLVLVNPTFYGGPNPSGNLQDGQSAIFSSLNVSGATTLSNLTVTGDETVQGSLTVEGSATFAADITVDGHIITAGNEPTAVVQSAAGTSATCSVSGDDSAGQISITTGTASWNSGAQCTLTFSSSYPSAPHTVITPVGTTNPTAIVPTVSATTTTLTINFINSDTGQHTYTWNYANLD